MAAERMRAAFPQAEQKALTLLRFWLSPEQAEQYDSQKHFEVVGSDTGTRYRIRRGRMMNIDQLDSAGNKVCTLCFLPVGNKAASDCMLAQKIALETFECEALAIANQGKRFDLGSFQPLAGAGSLTDCSPAAQDAATPAVEGMCEYVLCFSSGCVHFGELEPSEGIEPSSSTYCVAALPLSYLRHK